MFHKLILAIAIFTLVGCAAPISSPEQRQQQTKALRENTIQLSSLAFGANRADVLARLGAPTTKTLFREAEAEKELWVYPTETGYTTLHFSGDKLVDQKIQRTVLRFARDTSIPLTQSELDTRFQLSMLRVGASKSEVKLRPTNTFTPQQTAELVSKLRTVLSSMKDSPVLIGVGSTGIERDMRGEMWIYEGQRLSVTLFFEDQLITRIVFSEQPTEAQMNDMLHRSL